MWRVTHGEFPLNCMGHIEAHGGGLVWGKEESVLDGVKVAKKGGKTERKEGMGR